MKSYLLYTLEYPPDYGGVADYYYNLFNHWPEKNISLYHLTNTHTRFYYLPKLALDLNKKVDRNTHVLVGHILPLGSVVFLLKLIINIEYSVILHGLDFSLSVKNKRKRFLTYLILKKAKKIICANSYLADLLMKEFPKFKEKIIISFPGAKVSKADSNLKKEIIDKHGLQNKKIIFSIGRLVPRKGFDYCLNAIAQIKQIDPALYHNLVYLLAGDGEKLSDLKSLVRDYGIEDKVIFLGKISQEEKYVFYDLCDLFVMTPYQQDKDFEGFGIVYLEANLFSKPVIASNSGGILDAVVDNFSGLIVPPKDSLSLSQKMISLLNNLKLSQQLGLNGQKRAVKYFNWKHLANNLYKKL